MDCLKEYLRTYYNNCVEATSNIIAPFIALVEIGCGIASWAIFLDYLVSYSQKDITGYEYYDKKVFVFQGNGLRQRVSDPDCEYIESVEFGNNIISYLEYFPQKTLVILGSAWLFLVSILIGFLIIYFLLKLKKVEINKRRKNNFNAMKLIFDFVIPLVMIPISSVRVNDYCVTGYPYYFFLGKDPIVPFRYSLALTGILILGYLIAIYYRWPLYTMFYAAAKKIFACIQPWQYAYSFASLFAFGFFLIIYWLCNPLELTILSLISFFLTLERMVIECEELEASDDLHSVLYKEFRDKYQKRQAVPKQNVNQDNMQLTAEQEQYFIEPFQTEATFKELIQVFKKKILQVDNLERTILSNEGFFLVKQQNLEEITEIGERFSIFFTNLTDYQETIRTNPRCCWCICRFKLSNKVKDIRKQALFQQFRILFMRLKFQKINQIGDIQLIINRLEAKLAILIASREQLCNSKLLSFWELRNLKVDVQIMELISLIEKEKNPQNQQINVEIH